MRRGSTRAIEVARIPGQRDADRADSILDMTKLGPLEILIIFVVVVFFLAATGGSEEEAAADAGGFIRSPPTILGSSRESAERRNKLEAGPALIRTLSFQKPLTSG
jgi:hypothetical protein